MSSETSSRDLANIASGLRLLQDLSGSSGTPEWTDRVDASGLRLVSEIGDVPFEQLTNLLGAGGRVSVEVDVSGWTAHFEGAPRGGMTFSVKGEAYQAFDGDELQRARSAIEAGSAQELYVLCAQRSAHYALWIENNPADSGFHWYRRRQAFLDDLSHEAALIWIGTHLRMNGVRRFVLHDAGTDVLRGPSLVVHGPDAWPSNPAVDPWSSEVRLYSDAFLSHRAHAAPPPILLDISVESGLEDIHREVTGWAHVLCWWWLASDVVTRHDEDGRVRLCLRFDGARVVMIDVPRRPRLSAAPSLELWRWATTTADHDRREAIQRAVSLAATAANDLEDPAPIFRSAKWLLDLARRAAVAEGFATRRAARETTLASSRAASDAASSAASRALDRTLVQTAGAAGILVAQYKSAIDSTVAARLLGVVFALVLVFGSISYFVEFPSARKQLDAATRDLGAFRETLSADDILEFSKMSSIAAAKRLIQVQRVVSLAVSVAAAVVFAVVALRLASLRSILSP